MEPQTLTNNRGYDIGVGNSETFVTESVLCEELGQIMRPIRDRLTRIP